MMNELVVVVVVVFEVEGIVQYISVEEKFLV